VQLAVTLTLLETTDILLYVCQHKVTWHAWPWGIHHCCYWRLL